jgi:hypothetical protein
MIVCGHWIAVAFVLDRYRDGTNVVLLAPDVAKAFQTEEAVNEALRLVIRLGELPGPEQEAEVTW